MKWENTKIRLITGFSFSGSSGVLAKAINQNAEVLCEAVNKIEFLSEEIKELRKELENVKKGIV